jgi:hypothetical protein
MPGRWKLSRAEQRTWARSNRVAGVRLPPNRVLTPRALAVAEALGTGDRRRVQAASQQLLDAACALLQLPPLRVEVGGVRPRDGDGELHGLYTPSNGRAMRDRVQVWMHTAKRRQVVAFKTFLRTLLHELCHHIDYERLKLDHSFHTEGFYKRESSLMYAVLPRTVTPSAPATRPRRLSASPPSPI